MKAIIEVARRGSIFTVKVLERRDGSFAAHPDVAVRGADGHPDAYAGLGDTPNEALEEALKWFWHAVQEHGATQPEDFVWEERNPWLE